MFLKSTTKEVIWRSKDFLTAVKQTQRVEYLNDVHHQISSLVGSFKKTNAFLVDFICSNDTVYVKWKAFGKLIKLA